MNERRALRTVTFALIFAAPALALRATTGPLRREALGPSRCVRCHVKEAAWWQKADGPPPHGHLNALLQLESPDAKRYVARAGIKDVYAAQAGCVTCHATVFRGDAREGVSCESCHGPGSDYVDLHADPGAYRLAVGAGMDDLVGNVKAWARRCLTCHLITDRPLLAAGHSSGRSFDLADKYRVVAPHWKRTYTAGEVAAAGREAAAALATQAHER